MVCKLQFQWEAGIRSGVRRNSTPICASTTAEWVEEKVFEMVKAKELGADLVEARLDFLKDFHPAQHHQSLINNRPLPILITYRYTYKYPQYLFLTPSLI